MWEREGFGETAEGWQRDSNPWKKPCLPAGRGMRSLPRATLHHYPPKPCSPPLSASYYPNSSSSHHTHTHTHTHTRALHTHLTVLFIDDSSLPFLSGYTVNTGALAPRGPNGLISTVYSCALSRMTHKGTKRPLCAGELFLSPSTGPTDARRTFFFESPPVSSSLTGPVVFSPGFLSARPSPSLHPFICRKFFTLSRVTT